jgi:ADP-ribosylglycohydrolase
MLIGDALGVPYEFHPPARIPPAQQIEFIPPDGFHRAHSSVKPGTWSDDSAHALCLLASLLDRGQFDPADLGRRLLDWYDTGYMAVEGKVFDVGNTTSAALHALRQGVPPLEAGPADVHDNGNGALMRVLPLALWHQGTDEELAEDAHRQSRVTHGHARSQICCALYCLWAKYTLAAVDDPWQRAVAVLRALYGSNTPFLEELEGTIRPDDTSGGRGTGYVVDCLRSALWATEQGNYEQVVKAAIALGHDTDTTACVAGGIAGLRDGVDAIPERWRAELRGVELVEPLLDRLCQRIDGRSC